MKNKKTETVKVCKLKEENENVKKSIFRKENAKKQIPMGININGIPKSL